PAAACNDPFGAMSLLHKFRGKISRGPGLNQEKKSSDRSEQGSDHHGDYRPPLKIPIERHPKSRQRLIKSPKKSKQL
ncbi:MAG: hypothetical protein KTR15_14365, partial [Phycisphaeraceae bacterium]|nr:hypothetical protein [Phycisphaeraceae bacterium]